MPEDQNEYDPSIHFWFREGTCVISGRSYNIKEIIKEGDFKYIGSKKIWLVTPARGWQLQTIANELGFDTQIHRTGEEGEPDVSSLPAPGKSKPSHVLPFQPKPSPSDEDLPTLLAQARTLIDTLSTLTDKLNTSLPDERRRHNGN